MASISTAHFAPFSGYAAFLEALDHEPSHTPGPLRPGLTAGQPAVVEIEPRIRKFFGYVSIDSKNALSFHTHPVIRMVVNYMQGLEDATYPTDKNHPGSDGVFRSTLFPKFDSRLSPSQFTIDGLRTQPFKEGGVALTAKAFYNRSQYLHDEINVTKFDQQIRTINAYIEANAPALFAEYYRQVEHLIPSTNAVAQYTQLICSRAYCELKSAEKANAMWNNPVLEIFNHFVKLRALGAYDTDILFVYNHLMKSIKGLTPDTIRPLDSSPSSWKSYRGWLFNGNLGWADMDAQNLDRTTGTIEHFTTPKPYLIHNGPSICQFYMDAHDYKKPSSCFAGDTMVMLADGQSLRAIQNIKVGDEVQTFRFLSSEPSNPVKRSVAFVVQVPREWRTLYELKSKPGILFTETHPLIIRGNVSMPVLGFVNPDLAKSLNPTWQSIPTKCLESVEAYPASDANRDEILYDLILEPNGDEQVHPSLYVLCNASGQTLEAVSEAPLMEWFPFATCFIYSIMQELTKSGPGIFEKLLQSCQSKLALSSILENASSSTWAAVSNTIGNHSSKCTNPEDINIQSMFSHVSPKEQMHSAMFIETLIGQLGRRINDCIGTAWINDRAFMKRKQKPFLVFNTMTYSSVKSHPEYPMHEKLRFLITHNDVKIADQILSVEREGWMTFEIQHAIELDTAANSIIDIQLHVFDIENQPLFHGKAQVLEDVTTLIDLAGGPSGDQATLKLKLCMLDPDLVEELQTKWDENAKVSFAAEMGRSFTRGLFENATKGISDLPTMEWVRANHKIPAVVRS